MVYETNTKPKPTQPASIGRVKKYKYTDYVEKWEEIYSIFSKEAVLKGFFDKFITDSGEKKRGTSRVDSEFLKEINQWRKDLANQYCIKKQGIKCRRSQLCSSNHY